MAVTAVGNAELDRRPLILDEARELLIRALVGQNTIEFRTDVEMWLEDYWKRYGKGSDRGSDRTEG